MTDVAGPCLGVGIGAAAQAREQVEFQMIVRVDESGKDQIAVNVHYGCRVRSREFLGISVNDAPYAAIHNFDIGSQGCA